MSKQLSVIYIVVVYSMLPVNFDRSTMNAFRLQVKLFLTLVLAFGQMRTTVRVN